MKPNSIPSAGTEVQQRTDVEDTNVSPFFAKPNVVRRFNHSDGCGVQCVSYVSKVKADKVREMASADFINNAEVVAILKKLGLKAKQLFSTTIFPNKKYIVVVPSLNTIGEFHYVVIWCNELKNGFSGKVQVFDPVVNPAKKRYASQTKSNLSNNEFKICSWTSIIEVCP